MTVHQIFLFFRFLEGRLTRKLFRGQIRLEYLGIVVGVALVLFVVLGVLAAHFIEKANSPAW